MSPRRKAMAPEVAPGTAVGPYRVEERLGSGGFGTVFRAESGGQLYALKLLALQDVGEWAEREVVALARVKHPNVAQLRGFWQWPEKSPRYHVVVMEYVPGRRLDVWTRTENPSARRVLRLLLGMASGLAEAHREKVVHRDVKEANTIVREPDGEAVLVDFGVSGYEKASRVTRGKLPPGTVEYRSPEAWRFLLENEDNPEARYHPTPKDDIFALGVVLYWLLTDVLPFAASDGEGVEELLTRPPVAPHVRNPAVPEELSALCLRLLEKRPEARPDAEAVCKAAEELLTREGAAWDEPLCEFFGEHNVTTVPEQAADAEARWLNELRHAEARPRRGRRPPLVVEVTGAAPPGPAPHVPPATLVPALSGAAPASMVELRLRIPALGRWGRMVAGLVLVVALGALAARYSSLLPTGGTGSDAPRPTWEGRKVAPPLKPPEAEHAAPLAAEGVSSAPVASVATAPEDGTSVKTPQKKRPQVLGAMKKAAALAGACSTLGGCPGPATGVRASPSPPLTPAPCPPGAVQAMKERGIHPGVTGGGSFFMEPDHPQPTTVSLGWTSVRVVGLWKKFPEGAILSGELIFGEKRVYGRLTQARTEEGTFPVCIELWDVEGGRGLVREGESGPNTAKVFSSVVLYPVDHFK